jgi:hypothetical protein
MKEGQGFAKRITSKNLERFKLFLKTRDQKDSSIAPDETQDSDATNGGEQDPELKKLESEFDGKRISIKLPFKPPPIVRPKDKSKAAVAAKAAAVSAGVAAPQAAKVAFGPLIWEKPKLPKSDAQQVKAGTHAVGGLRLTQSGFKVSGKVINQTKYFRESIFNNLNWKKIKTKPLVETAECEFQIKVLGNDLGLHNLTIRHKPSGEAGQGNYTTLISWQKVSGQIQKANIAGKTLRLYGPPAGQKSPFLIEVI